MNFKSYFYILNETGSSKSKCCSLILVISVIIRPSIKSANYRQDTIEDIPQLSDVFKVKKRNLNNVVLILECARIKCLNLQNDRKILIKETRWSLSLSLKNRYFCTVTKYHLLVLKTFCKIFFLVYGTPNRFIYESTWSKCFLYCIIQLFSSLS